MSKNSMKMLCKIDQKHLFSNNIRVKAMEWQKFLKNMRLFWKNAWWKIWIVQKLLSLNNEHSFKIWHLIIFASEKKIIKTMRW